MFQLGVYPGVSQGSVLGPHLFLININDLQDQINSTCKVFANDTSLFLQFMIKFLALNNDLQKTNDKAF